MPSGIFSVTTDGLLEVVGATSRGSRHFDVQVC
jgi:hypothetical protein